jgi:hypothetical protein
LRYRCGVLTVKEAAERAGVSESLVYLCCDEFRLLDLGLAIERVV